MRWKLINIHLSRHAVRTVMPLARAALLVFVQARAGSGWTKDARKVGFYSFVARREDSITASSKQTLRVLT
jgi:hypothetical protein